MGTCTYVCIYTHIICRPTHICVYMYVDNIYAYEYVYSYVGVYKYMQT